MIDTLGEVAVEAKKRGIALGIEVVNRYESNLFNTLSDAKEAILAIGADNIVVHADTYHMNYEEHGLYQPLVDCADVLGYMHMSENHRGQLGSGTVNWGRCVPRISGCRLQGTIGGQVFCRGKPAFGRGDQIMASAKSILRVFGT